MVCGVEAVACIRHPSPFGSAEREGIRFQIDGTLAEQRVEGTRQGENMCGMGMSGRGPGGRRGAVVRGAGGGQNAGQIYASCLYMVITVFTTVGLGAPAGITHNLFVFMVPKPTTYLCPDPITYIVSGSVRRPVCPAVGGWHTTPRGGASADTLPAQRSPAALTPRGRRVPALCRNVRWVPALCRNVRGARPARAVGFLRPVMSVRYCLYGHRATGLACLYTGLHETSRVSSDIRTDVTPCPGAVHSLPLAAGGDNIQRASPTQIPRRACTLSLPMSPRCATVTLPSDPHASHISRPSVAAQGSIPP